MDTGKVYWKREKYTGHGKGVLATGNVYGTRERFIGHREGILDTGKVYWTRERYTGYETCVTFFSTVFVRYIFSSTNTYRLHAWGANRNAYRSPCKAPVTVVRI
jgi:hypothetical protein